MKTFYNLLTLMLALVCSVAVNAQKYKLVSEAKTFETGTTYAIVNTESNEFMSCKYGANGGLLKNLEDDDVLWQIEATGEKTAAGYELYYIYSVGQQKYVQEVDFEGNPGLDGFDVFAYNGFNFELGDKATAAKVTIEKGTPADKDEAENEAWRTNGPSAGYVIARNVVVTKPDGTPWYMKFGSQNVNVAFEPYNEKVGWQFWTVDKLGAQDELAALVENYSKTEYVGGTDPGYYEQGAVDNYNESLEKAMLLVVSSATEEEYQAAISDLREKHDKVEKSMIPITDGYYYMVSGFDDFLNNFGVEKAAYANATASLLAYKTFDANSIDFVFHVEKAVEDDEYWVQNYSTGLYVAKGSVWYNSTPVLTTDKAEAQNLRQYVSGKWYWGSHTFHNTSYTPYASSNPVASDSQGNLTTWGQWSDDSTVKTHFNLWYMRSISEEQMAEFAHQKEQYLRTQAIEDLAVEGNELYAKLFTYNVDYTNPLITEANGGVDQAPTADNQITFSHIRKQGIATADKYNLLIDGDSSSYMQGSGYIDISISKTPAKIVTFEYNVRRGTDKQNTWGQQERPDNVDIYATNDTANADAWVKIASTDMGALSVPARYTVDLGQEYSFLRYVVNTNANHGSYFTISEFQVYKADVDKTTSQYYTVEGLATKADAMKQMIATKLATAENATNEDIEELTNAIAEVENLYADTLALSEMIEAAEKLATTVKFGEGVGECNDENAPAALLAAIEEARPYVSSTVSVTDLKAAINKLNNAAETFLATIKSFEEGKYYYIVSAEEGHDGAPMVTNFPTTTLTSGTCGIRTGDPDEDYTNAPTHIYRFIETEKGYNVQNVATGFYLPAFDAQNGVINASRIATDYDVNYAGNGAYTFTSQNTLNTKLCALGILKGDTISHIDADADQTWRIVEVSEETEAIISNRIAYNTEGIVTFPFNLSAMDVNPDFHMYGVKSMTQETNSAGELVTKIAFYEKTTAEAGEPVYYKWKGSEDPGDLIIPMPTEVTNAAQNANGLAGTLYSKAFGAGVAFISAEGTKVTTSSFTIPYQLGVIDPTYYVGEKEGEETAFELTITGLNAIPEGGETGDVNGDGTINSADAVSVYNYIQGGSESGITASAADVSGDGIVNSADVVEVYNLIVGGTAKSGMFVTPGSEVSASQIVPADENDKAIMHISVGTTTDLTRIPVTVTLSNPDLPITAAEASIKIPVDVKKFAYSEEDEDYVVEGKDRWMGSHIATVAAGTALHGADGFFFSIVSTKTQNFKGTEGGVITLYFDGSELAPGKYTVKMYDAIAVWSDKKGTVTYNNNDEETTFTIADGKATAVEGVEAETSAKAGSIITLDGQSTSSTQKGQIYIVDGKKVKF